MNAYKNTPHTSGYVNALAVYMKRKISNVVSNATEPKPVGDNEYIFIMPNHKTNGSTYVRIASQNAFSLACDGSEKLY
ncbi:hypothetical protein EDC32_101977 [Laceyella sacchari]|nr:hypothetical protein EDC32_101977 [Laceyella sacchari]